jgi:hypothetical protein
MEIGTVNFVYSIYRQIRETDESSDYTLFEFSLRFDSFCYVFNDELRARRVMSRLLEESLRQPHRLAWIWQEVQFEIDGCAAGGRREVAIRYLECAEKPLSDQELDLFNQRMNRDVS